MGEIVRFPEKGNGKNESFAFDGADDWFEAVKAMEDRFGGVSLADLEDGNKEAKKIADCAFQRVVKDAYRRNSVKYIAAEADQE